MVKRIIFGTIGFFILIILGFLFLLRGCLAAYDERSAISPALYFEKNSQALVFTIVKYDEATSYKSGRGITQKTVNTNYFIQVNDAITGERMDKKKVKNHRKVKNFPVTVMGSYNGKAWVFIGEPMAFDPFTLEKYADKEIIESHNPALAGKMPDQFSYYHFNPQTGELYITTTDGLFYSLSPATLIATPIDEDRVKGSPAERSIRELEKRSKALQVEDNGWHERFSDFNRQYNDHLISYKVYLDSTKYFNRMQDSIVVRQSRLRKLIDGLRDRQSDEQERQSHIANMNRGSVSYTDMSVGSDTFNGRWYGLSNTADLEKRNTEFRYQPVYTETARNCFYTAAVQLKDKDDPNSKLLVDDPEKRTENIFLQGGFLLDKSTGLPIHLANKDGFIVCYREKIGPESLIQLARTGLDGELQWSANTKLRAFNDWIYTGRRLIIMGQDNKELSSGEANVLLIIDLANGTSTVYDFFSDKMRKP